MGSYAVRYLVETYGIERVRTLVRTDTGDFREDIRQALGVSWPELNRGWFTWVSKPFDIPLSTLLGESTDQAVPITATRYHELVLAVPQRTVSLQIGSPVIRVGGESRTANVAPVLKDGVTMVPLQTMAEALGLKADWDRAAGRVTITVPENVQKPTPAGRYLVVGKELLDSRESAPVLSRDVVTRAPVPVTDAATIITGPLTAFLHYRLDLGEADFARGSVEVNRPVVQVKVRMVPRDDGRYRSADPIDIREDARLLFVASISQTDGRSARWTWVQSPNGKE